MKKDKTICLCAIVKNEEKVIKRLIDSCRGIIDYWIIIDTGSTDKTKEIIKKELSKIPGELHDSVFVNFSHNRNEVLDHAFGKADYLLLMDADMTVVLDHSFKKSDLSANWYMLRYTGDLDFAQPLLVSGHLPFRYEGATHEFISHPKAGEWGQLPSLRVNHLADGGMRYDKLERDIRLLTQETIDKPNDARSWFYLGQTYANMGKYDESIKAYEKRVELGGWKEEVYYTLLQIGVQQYNKKSYDNAILQFLEAYNSRPVRFEALYFLGLIHREKKNYQTAIIFFEKCLAQPYPDKDVLFVHRDQYEYLCDFELSICYFWIGNYAKAKMHGDKVKKHKSVNQKVKDQNDRNYEFVMDKLFPERKKNKSLKNDYIICSMFTVNTPYEEEVKLLQASMDDNDVIYEIVGVRHQGSWIKNTQLKPSVIKGVMEKYGKDVVWVDADAIFKKKPVFFDTVRCDVSFYTIKEWNEMLVGTVYFTNNKQVNEFLDKWIYLNEQNDNPDGKNFQILMEKENLNIVPLPAEYIKIFDNSLIKTTDPVIVHNQASRRFKEVVNIPINNNYINEQLIKLIGEKKSCTIVGNGPFTSDMTKEIEDSFIIRCNKFSTEYNGIGKRTDLNISSLYFDILPESKVDYPIFGVLPISNTAYQKYTDAKSMHHFWIENAKQQRQLGNEVWEYGDDDAFLSVFNDVATRINAFPTVGIMGIAMTRWIGFKKINLIGFTFFQTDKSHYFTDVKTVPSSHHNPIAEKELLQQWLTEDKIEYVMDELMYNNLNSYATT